MLSRLIEAVQVCKRALEIILTPARRSKEPKHRHLLIVSFDFPPGTVTGGQLPAFLARHAVRSGWRVTVLCGPTPHAPSSRGQTALRLLPEAVRVIRATGHADAAGFHPLLPYKVSPEIDGGFSQGVAMTHAGLRALRHDPPSHVLATGPTFNNFLSGRRLALKFGARLALQYRDEWTVMQPTFVTCSERSPDDEQRCLASADLVTFVTEGKAEIYRKAFPLLEQKRILVASNGWDPDILKEAKDGTSHLAHLSGKLVIAFTGRVTEEIPIQPFLLLLADVLDADPELSTTVVLSITGDQTNTTRAQLQAFRARHPAALDERPGVSQTTATEILREASVLLLLNNTRYAGVVPLKTFDYMVAGTPILAFGDTGEAGRIVSGTGAGVTVSTTEATGLRESLHRFLRVPREDWTTGARREWIRLNNRETVSDRLLHALATLD
jgi:hypothetical protein